MTLALDPTSTSTTTTDSVAGFDPDDFTLDLTVVESFTGIPFASCSTGDGCGQTCSGGASACNSAANDPS